MKDKLCYGEPGWSTARRFPGASGGGDASGWDLSGQAKLSTVMHARITSSLKFQLDSNLEMFKLSSFPPSPSISFNRRPSFTLPNNSELARALTVDAYT